MTFVDLLESATGQNDFNRTPTLMCLCTILTLYPSHFVVNSTVKP